MKGNKVLLIIQEIIMYAVSIIIGIVFLSILSFNSDSKTLSATCYLLIALAFVLIIIAVINDILAIINVFTGKKYGLKSMIIIKLTLLPWNILNIVYLLMVIAGMLNPFLLLAIPLVVIIVLIVTCCLNLPFTLAIISDLIKRK